MAFIAPFSRPFNRPFPSEVVSNQWWAGAYAAYDAKNAASLAASYIDLSGNGRNLLGTGVLPTHTPGTGWVFSGAQYLKTPVSPMPDGNFSAIVKFDAPSAATGYYLFGAIDSAGITAIGITPLFSSANHLYYHVGFILLPGQILSGTMAIAGTKGYLNGTPETGTMAWSAQTWPSEGFYIGASNFNNVASAFMVGSISSIGFWSSVLLAEEIAYIHSAMP